MRRPGGTTRAYCVMKGIDPGPRGGAREQMLDALRAREQRTWQGMVLVMTRVLLAALNFEVPAVARSMTATQAVDRFLDTLWGREYTTSARIEAARQRVDSLKKKYSELRTVVSVNR